MDPLRRIWENVPSEVYLAIAAIFYILALTSGE